MKTLKHILTAALAGMVLAFNLPALASLDFTTSGGGLYTASVSGLGQIIPDNTLAGVGYSLNFGASGLNIGDITVAFNTSGGYDGNIYAYLAHGSQIALLVNEISGAANSSGFDVMLTTGTGVAINTATGTAGQLLTGTYLADSTGSGLTTFQNTDPNGAWTIYFADAGPGDAPTLNSFSVGIAPVPEPVDVALRIFGGLMGLVVLARSKLVKRRLGKI